MTNDSTARNRRHLSDVATLTAIGLLAVLTIYSSVCYWHLRTITSNQQSTRDSTAALTAVGKLFSALQDAETSQRGFLLTDEPIYLEPYKSALVQLRDARRDLQQYLLDEPDQLERVGELDQEIDAKLDELAETIRAQRDEGPEAARRIVLEHRGMREMDAIRAAIDAIERRETERRDALRAASDVSIRYALASLLLCTFLGCGITAIGFYVVQREIDARRRLAEFLQAADRNKNEFLALLGHELRSPLAAIRNAVDVLQLIGTLPEPVEEMRTIIDRQTNVMGRLVDDLLDTSRIAHGKIELRKARLNLRDLIDRAVADMRSAVQGSGVVVDLDAPQDAVWVRGDETRLTQIVNNLLYNAVKFSRRGGRIAVQVAVRSASKRVRISVTDEGIGMDRQTLEHVFEPFAQGRANGNRSGGGLGLGLPLAKALVELHDGEIFVHSAGPGRGATFTVLLPLDERPAPWRDSAPAAENPSSRCRVLIIDDRRDSSYPLQRMLELGGHEVHVAVDGRTGVELARELLPNVVLCDIGLPNGMTGYDVARELRAGPETSSLLLVALTAYGEEEARLMAIEAGFDRHVAKPASLGALREILACVSCAAADEAHSARRS
jgi:signal transduction histidine kinase/ActR/RegA family two-component response regulator